MADDVSNVVRSRGIFEAKGGHPQKELKNTMVILQGVGLYSNKILPNKVAWCSVGLVSCLLSVLSASCPVGFVSVTVLASCLLASCLSASCLSTTCSSRAYKALHETRVLTTGKN